MQDKEASPTLFEQNIDKEIKDLSNIQTSLLQYKNLRLNFQKLVPKVLDESYYNDGADVFQCDKFRCEDIYNEYMNQKSISKIAIAVSIISILGNIGLITYHIWR